MKQHISASVYFFISGINHSPKKCYDIYFYYKIDIVLSIEVGLQMRRKFTINQGTICCFFYTYL